MGSLNDYILFRKKFHWMENEYVRITLMFKNPHHFRHMRIINYMFGIVNYLPRMLKRKASDQKLNKCDIFHNEDTKSWVKSSKVAFIVKDKYAWNDIQKTYNSHVMDSSNKWNFQVDLLEHSYLKNIIIDGHAENLFALVQMATDQRFMPLMLLDDLCDSDSWAFDPYFIGWFWNDPDQIKFYKTGERCLNQLLAINEISDQMESMTKVKDLNNFWILQQKRLHVTDIYFGSTMTDEAKIYYKKVKNHIFETDTVTVTGLLVTPRTFSGHVQLSPETESLFPAKDDVEILPHVTLAVTPKFNPVQSGIDQMKIQNKIRKKKSCLKKFMIDLGEVQDWGKCQYYVELSEPLLFNVLFSTVY